MPPRGIPPRKLWASPRRSSMFQLRWPRVERMTGVRASGRPAARASSAHPFWSEHAAGPVEGGLLAALEAPGVGILRRDLRAGLERLVVLDLRPVVTVSKVGRRHAERDDPATLAEVRDAARGDRRGL